MSFDVQEVIHGIEVGTGGMFNGTEFVPPFEVCFEHKKFFTGNLGPNTGEQGTVLYFRRENRLAEPMLQLTEFLRKQKYHGMVGINYIVNADGMWPLEWTMRFGYPAEDLYEHHLHMPLGDWLYWIATGKSFEMPMSRELGIVTVVAVPPYPVPVKLSERGAKSEIPDPNGELIHGLRPHHWEQIHVYGMRYLHDSLQVAGHDGYVLTSTGSGKTIDQARSNSLAPLHQQGPVYIPDMFYRSDIGAYWEHDSQELENLGFSEVRVEAEADEGPLTPEEVHENLQPMKAQEV